MLNEFLNKIKWTGYRQQKPSHISAMNKKFRYEITDLSSHNNKNINIEY